MALPERLRDLVASRCCDFTGYGEPSGPYDPELGDALTEAAERLEALEEIRQRVADGWRPVWVDPLVSSCAWVAGPRVENMSAEVAAVLWPAPPTGDTA